jgi:hypothetical protein
MTRKTATGLRLPFPTRSALTPLAAAPGSRAFAFDAGDTPLPVCD